MSASWSEFADRCRQDLSLDITSGSVDELRLQELFNLSIRLKDEGRDGIWARIIKNALMPLFVGQFDYVVGNPPWVNWESLPSTYRNDSIELWQHYGLFPSRGFRSILGAGCDDISVLMFYVAIDRFLAPAGKLGFVITQTLFKTEAGRPFRRFELPDRQGIQILHVDDMVVLQPFEGARNRTSVVVARKGRSTEYPVPYTVWRKKTDSERRRIGYDATLDEVVERTVRSSFVATPIDGEPTSPWFTGRRGAIDGVRPMLGESPLRARTGVHASANGVFWLDVLERQNGYVFVRNRTERARIPIHQVETEIEEDLVFPLLLGRDVKPFEAEPSASILMTHRPEGGLKAIAAVELESKYPLTFEYLSQFEETLRKTGVIRRYFTRSVGKQTELTGPFYSMFNVGAYTFSEWKVVWPEISSTVKAAAISEYEGRVIIPDHKLVMFAAGSEGEAHYLAAVLNSTLINLVSASYAVSTQLSTHLFEYVNVPKFDESEGSHAELAALSQTLHVDPSRREHLQGTVDAVVGSLWHLSSDEVDAIRATAEDLMG